MTDWGEFQNDLAWEQYMEDQYLTQVTEEGVDAFSRERLQAYYVDNPALAQTPLRALRTAEGLIDVSASASLVFAASSLEITLRDVILRPLLHGLVHNEALASYVAQCAVERQGTKSSNRLLVALLQEYAGVDLSTYCREGQRVTLWDEVGRATKLRNDVVHRGEEVTNDDVRTALDVSTVLLHEIFPAVAQALDLTVDEDLNIGGGEPTQE